LTHVVTVAIVGVVGVVVGVAVAVADAITITIKVSVTIHDVNVTGVAIIDINTERVNQ